jgi:hypothetical protein
LLKTYQKRCRICETLITKRKGEGETIGQLDEIKAPILFILYFAAVNVGCPVSEPDLEVSDTTQAEQCCVAG